MKSNISRFFVALTLLFSTALFAFADHLTPEEALRRVESSGPKKVAGTQGVSRLSLAFTQSAPATDIATVYVFNHADGQNGFLVLAADDAVGDIMLGYSDDSTFNPNDIPSSMQWLLGAYSEYVNQATKTPKTLSLKAAPKKAARTSIAPMVQTKWNQGSPYNDNCPLIGRDRCVTGCVATAMAQVMKFHEWPVQGVGSYTHKFECKGVEYTTSADFGATRYDWANMTNTYSNKSTDAENAAVATLMHHCGVASKMGYTPQESGTSDIAAAQGLITYFNYDKSIQYLQRAWFDADEWTDLVYEHLAQTGPLMYSGVTSKNEGHEFVCDGYSSTDDMFHINWGWGGTADGYFMLSNLDPSTQGIGGSAGSLAFNYGQSILYGIQPDADGSLVSCMGISELSTNSTEYARTSTVAITCGLYSYSLAAISTQIALQFKNETDTKYVSMGSVNLNPYYGYPSLDVSARVFPVGEWDMSFVYTDETGAWKPAYYDHTQTDGYLHVTVTSDKVTFGSSTDPTPTEGTIEGTLKGIIPTVESDGDNIYIGHSYNFRYELTTNSSWSGTLCCVIVDNSYKLMAYSDALTTTVSSTVQEDFLVELSPNNSFSAGTYKCALGYLDGSTIYFCSDVTTITVAEYSEEEKPKLDVSNITWSASNGQDESLYIGNEYDFTFNLTTETGWNGTLVCLIADKSNNILSQGYANKEVTVAKDATAQETFRVRMPSGLEAGQYILYLCYIDGEYVKSVSGAYVTLLEIPQNDDVNYVSAFHLYTARGYLPELNSDGMTQSAAVEQAGTYLLLPAMTTRAVSDAEYYIYCVNNQKFVTSEDFDCDDAFIDEPDGTFTLSPIGDTGKFIIAAKSTGHYLQFDGSNQLLISDYTALGDGYQWSMAECGQCDATTALQQVDIATGVEITEHMNVIPTVYNLGGQRVAVPGRGLYIIDGKKMVVK